MESLQRIFGPQNISEVFKQNIVSAFSQATNAGGSLKL